MECSCEIDAGDYGDGEVASFFKDEIRTARKAHTCCECRGAINPGDQYEHVAGVWEGKFDVYKTCPACLSVREAIFSRGYYLGGMWEAIEIELGEGTEFYSHCLLEMMPTGRAKVCDLMEKVWARDGSDC